MPAIDTELFYAANKSQWRKWLEKNYNKKDGVWLVQYKRNSGVSTISWSDAVDEALCFGWIDSIKHPIDEEKFKQFFSKRKASSTWSKVNKEKVEQLIASGKMHASGLACITIAKKNGMWSILDSVEALEIPIDLEKAFRKIKGSKAFFESQSKTSKKGMLQWLVLAKRPETRQQRINEIAMSAGEGKKPKQF